MLNSNLRSSNFKVLAVVVVISLSQSLYLVVEAHSWEIPFIFLECFLVDSRGYLHIFPEGMLDPLPTAAWYAVAFPAVPWTFVARKMQYPSTMSYLQPTSP